MLDPRREPELGGLGVESGGVVDIAALERAGISDDRARYLVEHGRWQSPYPRVFVIFSGPIPTETARWAALAYCGVGALLSHRTAGADYALCAAPAAVHVLVPYCRDVKDQRGLVLHRSRTVTAADADPSAAVSRTHIERTVLDLLRSAPTGEAALALVAAAIRSRRTTPDRIRAALVARPCTRWRRVVGDALPDISAGAQSVLEVYDARLRARHGLPAGVRQRRRAAGGVEYLDVVVEPWGLHVELDGRLGHDRAHEVWRDMRRDNRSELSGLRHLRYGWADVVDRGCEVAIEQAVVLRAQGWQGRFGACRRCPTPLPPGL